MHTALWLLPLTSGRWRCTSRKELKLLVSKWHAYSIPFMYWATKFQLQTSTAWKFSNWASIRWSGLTLRAWSQSSWSTMLWWSLSSPWTRERMPRAKTLLCCLIGGGATLESFLTSHLCCARCWQTHPTRAHLSGSSACLMPLLERISNVPSGTTLSWQCSLSTTNAMYEALGLGHCCLFYGLVEHYFPREGAK